MAITLKDLMDRLSKIEETQLVDLLQLTSEQIVRKFKDKILDNFEYLERELEMPYIPIEEEEEEYYENEDDCDGGDYEDE